RVEDDLLLLTLPAELVRELELVVARHAVRRLRHLHRTRKTYLSSGVNGPYFRPPARGRAAPCRGSGESVTPLRHADPSPRAHAGLPVPPPRFDALGRRRPASRRHHHLDVAEGGHDVDPT